MNQALNTLTITEAKEGLKSKKFSSVELTKACLERIKKLEGKINAFITVDTEEAIKTAKQADKELSSGNKLPLLGIPIAVKDNFCTKDLRTTAASLVLEEFVPPYDATVVAKLRDAGAVILGKTNLDAWAHGSSTETSDFGPTKNPWNTNLLPGGSSGGSAAAVAANETIAAIGSETAGSICQPASWCGVVGLKPTYGRVSRYGLIAMASSLDRAGPLTKTVKDTAQILQVLAGRDELDATTLPKEVPSYLSGIDESIKGKTIGVSDDYFEGVERETVEKVQESIKTLEKLGAKIKKLKLFEPKYAIAVYTILQRSEVSSNLGRYHGIKYGRDRSYFGSEAKRRIMLGTYALSAGYYDQYYKKAEKVRTLIVEDFIKAFKKVDLIVSPSTPSVALPLGSSINHPMFGEMADALMEPSSIAGLPSMNVPCGLTKDGLPIGFQFVGPQFSEKLLLNVAYKFEQTHERSVCEI